MRIKYEFSSLVELSQFFMDKADQAKQELMKQKGTKNIAVLEREVTVWGQAADIVKDAIIADHEE